MDVEREIRDFVVRNFLYGDAAALAGDDESLIERGLVDSTGVLEIVAFLEERFGITLTDDELVPDNLDSVARMILFVKGKLGDDGSR